MAEIIEFKNKKEEEAKREIDEIREEILNKCDEFDAFASQMNLYAENSEVKDEDMDRMFEMLHEIKALRDETDEKERSIRITPISDTPEYQQMWKDAWKKARRDQTGFSVVE